VYFTEILNVSVCCVQICSSKSEHVDPAKVKDYVERYVMKEKQLKKYLAKKNPADAAVNGATAASQKSDEPRPTLGPRKLSILSLPMPKLT
jgi:hypothetical protein